MLIMTCPSGSHSNPASTALGPSAGPQSQLAQNLVLSWLGGSRIHELKTVQILDELEIPRPCIDAQTVAYNVEWSQELKLEQSLCEYVKGSMLIDILTASGELDLAPGFDSVIYDMSVGYDLAGIKTDRVCSFIEGMKDASHIVDQLRKEIPDEFAKYRDLDFRTNLSDSLTLSTFHGCPPEEIEQIIDFLLREHNLHCTIKLNPTLLGPDRLRELMCQTMGYTEAQTPDTAFENDTKWDQMVGFVGRLGETADALGLGLGVKFSNTLIVRNHRDFFPEAEKEMYLSGQPLHVLAMNLVREFRREFGDRYPISFSGGIDRRNFADAVAIGLTPVTVCTDLLRPGGYARQQGYLQTLVERMDDLNAPNINDFILKAYGSAQTALQQAGGQWGSEFEAACEQGTELATLVDDELLARWLSAAKVLNTELYVETATADQRFTRKENLKVPKKMDSTLELFNCITCDKCVPVCPNDANFTLEMPKAEIPILKLTKSGGSWITEQGEPLILNKKHQIANFADFCNECGNCDIFCPELGGPYVLKPRFFGSLEEWTATSTHDGFFMERSGTAYSVHARFDSKEYYLKASDDRCEFSGEGFSVTFDPEALIDTIAGDAGTQIDLTYYYIIDELRKAIFADSAAVNYVNA